MNFAQMLLATPLVRRTESKTWDRDTRAAVAYRRENTLAKYRAVWGSDEWLIVAVIASRLGYGRMSILKTLARWEKEGLMERRQVDARTQEWRWIK